MSDLGTARLKLIDVTGRRDFVTGGNVATNADAGGDAYLMRAQKKLDQRGHYLLPKRRHFAMLRSGIPWLEIGNLLAVTNLQLTTSGEDKYAITTERMHYDEFRAAYPEVLADQADGAPVYWAFNPNIMSPDNYAQTSAQDKYDGVLNNSDAAYHSASSAATAEATTGEIDAVTNGSWPGATDGTDVWFAHTPGDEEPYLFLDSGVIGNNVSLFDIRPGRVYEVKFEWKAGTAGTYTFSLGGGVGQVVDVASSGVITLNLVAGATSTDYLTITPSSLSDGQIFTVADTEQVLTITEVVTSPYNKRSILFSPKPDADYSVEILGKFLSRTLTANTDQSFWTAEYLNALVAMAAAEYYGEMRNSTARREHLAIVDDDLNDGDSALVAEELSGMDMEPLR